MSEKKFKVGDRVRCIDDGGFNRFVESAIGTVVDGNSPCGNVGVKFDKWIDGHSCGNRCEHGYGWYLIGNSLELLNEDWKVLIMPEGDTTTGRLYEDGKVVKSVSTKKHPDDEYSINKACEVIMDRLFPKIIKQDKYEVGDKVKIVDKWNGKTGENARGLMDKYLGTVMTIRDIDSDGDYLMEEDKTEWLGDGWYWNKYCIEGKVVDTKEPPKPVKPTYYNGKVVCVEANTSSVTLGKIYEVEDGHMTFDNGSRSFGRCKDFEDLCNTFTSKFIEVVE